MAKAPINVSIAGDYNNKDINRAIKDLNSLKTGGTDTSKSMGGLSSGMKALGGVMAATFSLAVITDFFSNSIAGALADEKAMKSLEIALGNVGAAHARLPILGGLHRLAQVLREPLGKGVAAFRATRVHTDLVKIENRI
jgi:hypothetical protein